MIVREQESPRSFVEIQTSQQCVVWHIQIRQAGRKDVQYLTVQAGALLADKRISAGVMSIQAGRLGKIEVKGDQIILGPPLMMNKSNIDNYDF